VLLTAWFYWHLHTTLARLGGGAGLLVLLGAVWKIITALAPQVTDWKKRLARGSTTWVIVVCLVVAIVLVTCTASVYVEFAGAPKDVEAVELRIIDPPGFYAQPLRVYADTENVAGRPFFPVWTLKSVTLQIVKPSGWKATAFAVPPSHALYVRVPRQLEPKAYHVVRVLPGPGVNLPKPWNIVRQPFTLTIRAGGGAYSTADLRARPLLLGTSVAEIAEVDKRSATIVSDIPIALRRWPDLQAREQDEYRAAWLTQPDVVATHDLAVGERVTVAVTNDLGNPVCRGSFRVTPLVLETLIMEGTSNGKCTFSTMAGSPRS